MSFKFSLTVALGPQDLLRSGVLGPVLKNAGPAPQQERMAQGAETTLGTAAGAARGVLRTRMATLPPLELIS